MATYSDMAASLREVGYRLTPQRMMILATIHQSAGHITAEAIHERVKEQYPFVDISTVYRTLQLLKKLRLITETDLGEGVVEYELSERGRHHHLVCRQCGKTAALDDSFLTAAGRPAPGGPRLPGGPGALRHLRHLRRLPKRPLLPAASSQSQIRDRSCAAWTLAF